jgi:hypothetical protein
MGAEVALDVHGTPTVSQHSPRLGAFNAPRIRRARKPNAVAPCALRAYSVPNVRPLGASWRNARRFLLGESGSDRRREDHGQRGE